MATFVITYDLHAKESYTKLYEAIKACASGWWHCVESTWIISSSLTAATIRDRLWATMYSDDQLLVANVGAPAAWAGMDDECSNWLLSNLK